ncbi:MAG: FAD-binding oxidoreductase [Methylococcales bacterium]|nr:FAD-binding oxidoreductase [Methylococcales bacterium]
MQIDVLIVGQGLAGSLLARELIRRQCRVLVVDSGTENASQVAAGLINPVSGQRLVKHRTVDSCLPAAMAAYRQLAAEFGQPFFVELPMLRILQSAMEREYAAKRLLQADYQPYLSGWATEPPGISAPYGVLRQTGGGYLRTRLLLSRLRAFLTGMGSFRQTGLAYEELRLYPDLQWRAVRPRHVVFCEGHQALANPWFGGLPFQLAKGEILACESAAEIPQSILNYGKWLIPLSGRRFKTGASFETRQPDAIPTADAKAELLAALAKAGVNGGAVSVYEHKAGIRPATLDKQPLIGSHPRHAGLHIFNGFGSKGSLYIPWYARQLADLLLQGHPLPDHADIKRYHETHFPA